MATHPAPAESTAGPPAVLFLVPNLITGGAERQLALLVPRMDRTRFTPIVVCQKDGGPFYDEIARAGIETHQLGFHGKWDIGFPIALARLCRARHVRAIVIRGFSTGVVGSLVAKTLGIPLVMAEHSTGRSGEGAMQRAIERHLASWTNGVIAVAKGQVPYLVDDKGYDAKTIRVVYNGIDLTSWRPLPRDPALAATLGIGERTPVAGILAMLRPEKDHATFLKAAAIVARDLPDARFVIVGEGPEREPLERLAGELGLTGRALFLGRREDVAAVLSLFDVSVLTSVTVETFPMSFLEAMAMAKPLVATRIGGVPEMIDEGVNGHLVPLRDPAALAAALTRVLGNRERASAMGLASRRMVEERFTIEKMVRDTEAFLAELVERGPRRP